MTAEEFKIMFLLRNDLVMKEIEHYCICNPHTVNAMAAGAYHSPDIVKETMYMIYGEEKMGEFIDEIKKRRAKINII